MSFLGKNKEMIDQLQFSINNGESNFNMDLVTNEILDDSWLKIPAMSNGWEKAFHNFSNSFSSINKESLLRNGLYKATGKNLITYKDGSIGSFSRGSNGKIDNHSGFVKIDGSTMFIAALGIQVASILLQQLFDSTDDKLNKISEKLDYLTKFVEEKEISKLKRADIIFKDLIKKKAFTTENFVAIDNMINDIANVRETFFTCCIAEADMLKSNIRDTTHITYHNMAKIVKRKFNESKFLQLAEVVVYAEKLYHFSKLVDIYVNLHYINPDINRIKSIEQKINELENTDKATNDKNYLGLISTTLKDVQSVVYNELNTYKQKTSGTFGVYQSTILKIDKEIVNTFENFENFRSETENFIIKNKEEFLKNTKNTPDILIDNRTEKPVLYLKKSA